MAEFIPSVSVPDYTDHSLERHLQISVVDPGQVLVQVLTPTDANCVALAVESSISVRAEDLLAAVRHLID